MLNIFKTTIVAISALALSTVMASAVTLSFSDNGGNGSSTNLGPHGGFDYKIEMTSNNNKQAGHSSVWDGTTVAFENLLVKGVWKFRSNDKRNASHDPLGYFIGAVYTALSHSKKGPGLQTGRFSFLVPANTTFGWVLDSTDGRKGSSEAKIFVKIRPATVPLPAGGLMLVGAIGGLATLRRRKGAAAI